MPLLAVDNAIVNKTNFNMVHEIPEDLKTFKSLDTVDNDNQQLDFPVEFLYLYVLNLNPARNFTVILSPVTRARRDSMVSGSINQAVLLTKRCLLCWRLMNLSQVTLWKVDQNDDTFTFSDHYELRKSTGFVIDYRWWYWLWHALGHQSIVWVILHFADVLYVNKSWSVYDTLGEDVWWSSLNLLV